MRKRERSERMSRERVREREEQLSEAEFGRSRIPSCCLILLKGRWTPGQKENKPSKGLVQ